jgi:predicted AlkP superfamily pyrophosphatase or phosphodiesterase
MQRFFLLVIALVLINAALAQKPGVITPVPAKPKLVVGLVVDQMRWDYLYRYQEKYGQGGFNRLLDQGYACENTYINYFPSYTAPGHTGIYTGSVPAVHGIVGNDWFQRPQNALVYCTKDTAVRSVGGDSAIGQQSPHRLLTTTICDELRLSNNFRSKTIGIAIKDRGGILPAGHTANAAYWYDGVTGKWISSTYYMKALPAYVNAFNDKKTVDAYIKNNWNTLLKISEYWESTEDDKWYENSYPNEDKPVFEHQLSKIKTPPYELIKATPFGNAMTLDFAKAVIKGDTMGRRGVTDFVTVSCSSTDYVGHMFGPNSVEIEDSYIRLDREIESFLNYLDETVGKGNYLVFLSADHGAAHAIGFNQEHHLPGELLFEKKLEAEADSVLAFRFERKGLVSKVVNQQIVLNHELIHASKFELADVKAFLIEHFSGKPGIQRVIDLEQVQQTTLTDWQRECLSNHYLPGRSGDVQLVFTPATLDDFQKGTTHGTNYAYDTHIPLLFYGWGVKQGRNYNRNYMMDIAPTIAAMLKIQEPNGCVGKVIKGLLKE